MSEMSDLNAQSLHPGTSIRPILDLETVEKLVKDYYGFRVVHVVELNGYDDKNFHIKVEKIDEDYCVEGYVLKIINVLDSENPDIIDAQTSLLIHLGQRGIPCPKPIQSKNGKFLEIIRLISGQHIMRLLEFISGTTLNKITVCPNLYYEVGEMVANLDIAMMDFSHPAYEKLNTLWKLDSVTKLPQFLYAVQSENRKKLVEEVIKEFDHQVRRHSNRFRKGLIHGDANEQNILVEHQNGEWKIKAIIDFGDSHVGCYLYELAIVITYMMLLKKNIDAGGYVLAGFTRIMTISEEECSLLKVCIAARLCQSLVLGAYSATLDPTNKYVLVTSQNGWDLLENLWRLPEADIIARWKNAAQSFISGKLTEKK